MFYQKKSIALFLTIVALSVTIPIAAGSTAGSSAFQHSANLGNTSFIKSHQSDEKGSLSGRVTSGADGTPLADVRVTLYEIDGSYYTYRETDNDGGYEFNSIDSGIYRVKFEGPHDYYVKYYSDALDFQSATDIQVLPGQEVSGIDMALTAYGQITGRVVALEDGAPLENVLASAYIYQYGLWLSRGFDGITDENGNFVKRGLEPGIYRVGFDDHDRDYYLEEFYDDVVRVEDALEIQVADNQVISGIDAALDSYGWISGVVTKEEDGQPVDNMVVESYYYNGFNWILASSGKTDSSGYYELGGMDTGSYRVLFKGQTRGLANEYYDNASDIEDGIDIEVIISQRVTGIDASMVKLGRITGRVTAEKDGAPLEYIWIDAFRVTPKGLRLAATDLTDEEGNYVLKNLNPGSFVIKYSQLSSRQYVPEYYDNVQDAKLATHVLVSNGTTTSAIDAALAEKGRISGRVTAELDGRIVQAYVCVHYQVGSEWKSSKCELSKDGRYDIGGLSPGIKRIQFWDYDYVTEYYDDVSNIEEATNISVEPNVVVENIDAQLTGKGAISGRVTDENSGLPLQGISVFTVYHREGEWYSAGVTLTDANGDYKVEKLPGGYYHLSFQDMNYQFFGEYFNNVPDLDNADQILVSNGNEVQNINAALTPNLSGNKISTFLPSVMRGY